jgi:hypothetical protein
MNPLISGFVHDALLRGIPREDIAEALQRGGWAPKEINASLEAYVETGLPLPVPRKCVSSSPKEAFLFLMLFASLYAAAFALGSILFDLINLSLPQRGETAQWSIESLRYGIASVVVAFPIFLLMQRVISRENLRNPGQRISPVRRWLTYLTLFVASVSFIADLISLIFRFLEGDITLRFSLKVLVVAILAGGAFIYYLRDLRHDELAPSTELRATFFSRFGLAALIAAVAVTIGIGFWFAGSPMRARLLAQDEQRVSDLANISNRVQQYYFNKGSLPESLAACDINPVTFIEQKKDRVTGEPYLYRVIDTTRFELGATFALPGGSERLQTEFGRSIYGHGDEASFWEHPAGPKTYAIDAARKSSKS